jgi:hypothetical protein
LSSREIHIVAYLEKLPLCQALIEKELKIG